MLLGDQIKEDGMGRSCWMIINACNILIRKFDRRRPLGTPRYDRRIILK
jgi:hypothetical protein